MKKYFVTFISILLWFTTFAQQDLKQEFGEAVNSLKKNDFDKAIKQFTEVLDKATEPQVKKFALIYRGFAKNGLKDFTSAIADFGKAIELDPEDLRTYIDRGQSHSYAKNYEAAVKDFEFVRSKDSIGKQGQNALFHLAGIAYKKAQFELSVGFYDKLILLTPGDYEIYFNRGAAKDMLMDSQGSIKDYDKAIELRPGYKEAYANRGVAKINLLRKTTGKLFPTKEQTKDACSDLKKAKLLGDNTVDDMIFVHCDN